MVTHGSGRRRRESITREAAAAVAAAEVAAAAGVRCAAAAAAADGRFRILVEDPNSTDVLHLFNTIFGFVYTHTRRPQ